MRPHVGAKTLARYRQGDLTARRNARIGAHLAGCARCRARSEDLAQVTTLLASVHPPPIPQHLAARIQAALATEAAALAARPGEKARPGQAGPGERAAAAAAPAGTEPGGTEPGGTEPGGTGPAGTGPTANGHHPQQQMPRHGRRPRLPRLAPPVALRALAAAAAVVLLAGGVYELTQLGASTTSSSSAGSSAAGPQVPAPAPASQSQGAPAAGPALQYQHAGGPASINAVMSGTDYTPGNLRGQVAAQLAGSGRSAATAGPNTAGPEQTRSPAAVSGGRAATFGGIPVTSLAGCVNRIAAGGRVLLVDVARYQGEPATVIVTQPAGGGPEQIWVVGPGCSASRSDLLHQAEPGAAG
jgi:Putative zinc-finger